MMICSLFFALILRRGKLNELISSEFQYIIISFATLFILWFITLFVLDLYNIFLNKSNKDLMIAIFHFIFIAVGTGSAYFYFQPLLGIEPRAILLLTISLFTSYLYLTRIILIKIFSTYLREDAVVVGFTSTLISLEKYISNYYKIKAVFTLNRIDEFKFFNTKNGYYQIHDVNQFNSFIRKNKINIAIIDIDDDALFNNKDLIVRLPLTMHYIRIFDIYEALFRKVYLPHINYIWVIEYISSKQNTLSSYVKRVLDIVLSIFSCILALPIIFIVAPFIKMDSGPIFYTQKRIGQHGKQFNLYKLRTMQVDSEKNGAQWTQKNDQRVTRIGKILRSLYIDEFPQFLNILLGDMSFVGPRPERPEFFEKLNNEVPFYHTRVAVKPGLTGWAQIRQWAPTTISETCDKLAYDLYYIKHSSLFFDCTILLKTVRAIFIKY